MINLSYLKRLMQALMIVGFLVTGTAFAAEHGGEPVHSDKSDTSTESSEHPGDEESDQGQDQGQDSDSEESGQEHPGS